MRGDVTRVTPWVCDGEHDSPDGKPFTVTRSDSMQDVPPTGWRIVHILPTSLNLALEPSSPREIRRVALCPECFSRFMELISTND